MNNKIRSILFLLALTAFAGNLFSRDIGGYVADAEDRFARNVWNFLKEFETQKVIGGIGWKYKHYQYAAPFIFTTSNNSYVDGVDLAYCSGHGNPYSFQTKLNPSTFANFDTDVAAINGWGDWDGEFIVFQSCAVIPSELDRSNWWSGWVNCLKGIHQIIGYRTNSYSDNGISNNFAKKLKNNQSVMYAWFDAVDEERCWIYGASYPGYASALYYTKTEFEKLSSSESTAVYGYAGLHNWYEY